MSTTSNRRAALYLRQSLDRAEGIESQRERCTSLANARGWQIMDTFVDNETKASEDRGPETGWGRMLPRIGKEFDIVVSVDLDRLARNTRDLNKLIDLGAAVVTVDGEIDLTSADGEFRATMIVGIARFETRRASERQKRHKAAKAERGEWHGGTPPFGYSAKNGTLMPNESEVAMIREAIRRLLMLRETMHSIVTDWNNTGIKTRKGHHWRQSNLRAILLNRSLVGETKAGVLGWEPIIDAETFQRLQDLFLDPSRKATQSPGVKGGKYAMGGGLSVCGKCGKPLISAMKYRDAGPQVVLSCISRVNGPSEHHPKTPRSLTRNGEKVTVEHDSGRVSIGHEILQEYVFSQVTDRLNDTQYWHKRKTEADPDAEHKIAALNERRALLFEKRERAEDLALDGLISKDRLREQLRSIEVEIEQVAKDIDALVAPPQIESLYGRRDQILESWPRWTAGQRRAFLKLLIRSVVVNDWPEDMARVYKPRKGEPPADYERRHHAKMLEATQRRVTIQWFA